MLYFYVRLFVCRVLASFIVGLFNLYEDLYFTYLEVNPLGKFVILLYNIVLSSLGFPGVGSSFIILFRKVETVLLL